MSRTKPAERKKRNPLELYPTPAKATRGLLRQTEIQLPFWGDWIEPCVGKGAIVLAAEQFCEERGQPSISWDAMDINSRLRIGNRKRMPWLNVRYGNATTLHFKDFGRSQPWDVICTNPAFSIFDKLFPVFRAAANQVVLLLRVGVLDAVKRYPALSQDMPDVGVLTPRPSFADEDKKEKKGNDCATYGWFFWGEKRKTKGEIFLINCKETPV
jgi:hypothetical protein